MDNIMKYLVSWRGYEVGTIEQDLDGLVIESTDSILSSWYKSVGRHKEDKLFSALIDSDFTVERIK